MQWSEFLQQIGHFPPAERERIKRAFDLAQRLHEGQLRLSGEPYFIHPAAVAAMLVTMGADTDSIVAALLHDTAEDTPASPQEIGGQFNGDVVDLIDGLTKLSAEEFAEQPRLNEQVETLRKIFSLMEKDVRIMVIKLVDRLHNMRTIAFLSPERQRDLAQETLDVYVKIADRLSMQDIRYELEERTLAVLNPSLYQGLLRIRENNKRKGKTILPLLQETLKVSHADLLSQTLLLSEEKPWKKMQAQLESKGTVITGLASVNVAFVCKDRESCYRMLGALHENWKRETLSFQDFINVPVVNGYQGLHTTVILNDGTRVRCKIRTEEMERYNHHGVTLFCFRPERRELLASLLPWTKQIPSLTQDTKEGSMDFWESLQNDILGETITIYGPNDETAQLPKGATVLDGAFYLFQENALRLHSIKLNGKAVSFPTPLPDAATLDPSLSEQLMVHHTWIRWVHTRVASAMIRGVLAERSEEERSIIGKEMLQNLLSEQRRGFLEEFSEAQMDAKVRSLGYRSLHDITIALADGRIKPSEVYAALFPRRSTSLKPTTQSFTIRYTMNLLNADLMDRLVHVHRKYMAHLREIRYLQETPESGTTRLRAAMSPDQQQNMERDLAGAGAKNIVFSSASSPFRFVAGMFLLILLWGLDPVIGHFLLNRFTILPTDLVIVRFWSLTAMSVVLLGWTRFRNPLAVTRLPLRNPSLWLSVFLLFAVAFTTYFSLKATPPSHYTIPMTAAGLLLTSIVKKKHWRILLATWILLLSGLVLLVFGTPGWSLPSIVFTLLAVASFSAFSVVSERYKRGERVDVRAAQYFFILSISCAFLTLPLFASSALPSLPLSTVTAMVLYSIILAGLPYYMYYYMLSHQQIDFVLRYSFLIIPATFVGQTLLLGSLSSVTLIASTLVILGAILPLRVK